MSSKPLTPYFLASVAVVTATLLSGCGSEAPDSFDDFADHHLAKHDSVQLVCLTPAEARSLHVATQPVREICADCTVQTTGEVLANSSLLTHVTAPITGRVVAVGVTIGDHVSAGQNIATVRSTDVEQSEADLLQNEAQVKADLKRDLLQIDSDLSQASEQLKLSTSTYRRIEALFNEKIASKADFEAAKAQYEKDRITFETDSRKRKMTIVLSNEKLGLAIGPIKEKLRLLGVSDAEIERVEKQRKIDPEVPVISPTSGIVSERLVNVGELVDPAKPLFTIGDFHNVWIKADVYEKDVSKVHEGQPIELQLDSFPGESFKGVLNYVADSINQDTRTLPVRASVPNEDLKLKPKMFARMVIFTGKKNVVAVPAAAVQEAGSEHVVYVPEPGQKFAERKVVVGNNYGDCVEVVSGLLPGEHVVTDGSAMLKCESLKNSD